MPAFRHQFALFPRSHVLSGTVPEHWANEDIGDWRLVHCPDLPVQHAGDEVTLGWPVPLPDEETPGGRYLKLSLRDGFIMLKPDAGATLASVVCPESHCAASTPELAESLFSTTPSPFAGDLAVTKNSTGTWFPGGLTQLKGWEVLLPNHEVHLGQEAPQQRVWPPANHPLQNSAESLANKITSHLTQHLAGLSQLAPLEITLTGGRDSRMLLAASRNIAVNTLYAVNTPPPGQHMPDVEVSATLAETLGLTHTTNTPRDPSRILALGYGGEIARGHLWPKNLNPEDTVTPEQLHASMGFSPSLIPSLSQSLAHWLRQLPPLPAHTIYDLLYWEQRMATTMSFQLYEEDQAGSFFPACPLATRKILSAILQLPPDFRSNWKLGDHIVETAWPEANLVPYQKLYFTGREKLKTWINLLARWPVSPAIRRTLRSPRFRKILFASSRPHS